MSVALDKAEDRRPPESTTQSTSGNGSDERDGESETAGRPSAATAIVNLARPSAELFHSGEDSFATIQMSGHLETWPMRSRGFRSWLGQIFFRKKHQAASGKLLRARLRRWRDSRVSRVQSRKFLCVWRGTLSACGSTCAMRNGGKSRSMLPAGAL